MGTHGGRILSHISDRIERPSSTRSILAALSTILSASISQIELKAPVIIGETVSFFRGLFGGISQIELKAARWHPRTVKKHMEMHISDRIERGEGVAEVARRYTVPAYLR